MHSIMSSNKLLIAFILFVRCLGVVASPVITSRTSLEAGRLTTRTAGPATPASHGLGNDKVVELERRVGGGGSAAAQSPSPRQVSVGFAIITPTLQPFTETSHSSEARYSLVFDQEYFFTKTRKDESKPDKLSCDHLRRMKSHVIDLGINVPIEQPKGKSGLRQLLKETLGQLYLNTPGAQDSAFVIKGVDYLIKAGQRLGARTGLSTEEERRVRKLIKEESEKVGVEPNSGAPLDKDLYNEWSRDSKSV